MTCAKTVLEENSVPEPNTGCSLWTRAHEGPGYKTGRGYGSLQYKGVKYRAHRLAWEANNGPIPAGMYVLHSCDTPCCVNIDHLFLGTPQDNMTDMARKKRGRNQSHYRNIKGT
jgi:hypothetical protein